MAAEPRSSDPPDGPRTATGRAAGERAPLERSPREDNRVAYRCGACGEEFVVDVPGPAPCPRCQSVGDHVLLGRAGGEGDGR